MPVMDKPTESCGHQGASRAITQAGADPSAAGHSDWQSPRTLHEMRSALEQQSRWLRDYEISLNRRAEVEQELFDVANGKRPALTPERCRELAMKLGVPAEWLQRRAIPSSPFSEPVRDQSGCLPTMAQEPVSTQHTRAGATKPRPRF